MTGSKKNPATDEAVPSEPHALELPGYLRKYLRGLAHPLKPVVQVGQSGVTPKVCEAIAVALRDHELIKVRLHRPEDKYGSSSALASGTGSALCGLVGHTAILYKPHAKNPQIHLPKRPA